MELSTNQKAAVISGCLLASVTLVFNLLLLFISQYTSGGRSPTLIYVRSLFVCNFLSATFAVSKAIHLYTQPPYVNCFLPEAIVITSVSAASCVQVIIMLDAVLRLCKPVTYHSHMDKLAVLFLVIFCWNLAFIIGFVPQMGWNKQHYACYFFDFYSSSYLVTMCGAFIFYLTVMCILHLKICVRMRAPQYQQQTEWRKLQQTVVSSRFYLLLQVLCLLPCVIYILVYSKDSTDTDISLSLVYFIPLLQFKSLLLTVLYAIKSVEMTQIIAHMCCLPHLVTSGHQQEKGQGQMAISSIQDADSARLGSASNTTLDTSVTSNDLCHNCGHRVYPTGPNSVSGALPKFSGAAAWHPGVTRHPATLQQVSDTQYHTHIFVTHDKLAAANNQQHSTCIL